MQVLENVPSFIEKLNVYEPGKPIETVARELGINPKEIIKLASNESALGVSPIAKKAMKDAINEMYLYSDGGAYELKDKLANFYNVKNKELIIGSGSNEILEFIGHCFMSKGKNIVVSSYSFIVYRLIAKMFDASYKEVSTKNHFEHDLDAILKAIDENTSVVFICNPNNPTGTMLHQKEIDRFMDKVPSHVLVVFDEAYAEICLGKMPDTIKFVRENKNCIILRTFSKAYGLAGLRIGYGMAPTPIISVLEKVRQPFNTTRIGQIAATAALDDQKFVKKTRNLYLRGKKYMENEFTKMGLDFVPSFSNFILVKTLEAQKTFYELQKRGVIIRPMTGYGLTDWVRITFGTMAENERFIKELTDFIKK